MDVVLLAQSNIHETLSGQAFWISAANSEYEMSLLELLNLMTRLQGERPVTRNEEWRPGDQRYYVSDTRRFKAATG